MGCGSTSLHKLKAGFPMVRWRRQEGFGWRWIEIAVMSISRLLWAHMSEQQEFLDRHAIFGFWTIRNCNTGNISYTDFASNQKHRVIGLMMFGVSDGNINHRKEGCCQPEGDNEYWPISWGSTGAVKHPHLCWCPIHSRESSAELRDKLEIWSTFQQMFSF